LGLAQGLGTLDLLPFAEVQYLAYVYNAIDQLRGEACSLQYFSRDQFRNPMVVRIASFAYQKGFGGHFHNDNGIASLREIPALIVAAPCRGDDAMAMLRTCAALARVDGRVVAFLEPIALYNTRHLYQPDDGAWLTDSPAGDHCIMLGEGRVYHGEATDVALISYANGVHFSLRVARTLAQEHGIHARVIDLRWLSPLNVEFIVQQVKPCRAVVVVDEGRRTGGIAETIIAALVENLSPPPPVARVTGEDCYIPLGPAADWVLPTEERILAATIDLTKGCGN